MHSGGALVLMEPVLSLRGTLPQLLAQRAERTPSALAIHAVDRSPLSFAGLVGHMGGVASAFADRGLGRTDAVAVMVPTGPEMATAFLSVAGAAVCAPLNPAYGRAELEFYLDDLSAKALLIAGDLDSPAREVARARGIGVMELTPGASESAGRFTIDGTLPAPAGLREALPDDVALVLHTSGTTSRPKMVPLAHANLAASASHIGKALALGPADRCLNVMPLFHIHGLIGATLSSLVAGGSVACPPGFLAPRFFDWLEQFGPTWYSAVPTVHQAILDRAEANTAIIERSRLRFIRSSSSALPRPTLLELERVFHVPVVEAYGMTEAAHQMASNPLPPLERKAGSVGMAAGPEIGIMDPEGALLRAGVTGEVVIRGPNVTRGYVHNPSANAVAFTGGWFRTGDQGHLDEDGYLFLTGRLKELINRGGEKISPFEIDEALMAHPGVAQALSFSVPHPTLGEEVAAAVVLRPGLSVSAFELRECVAERLVYFKVPRRIVFLDALPKGPTGKPQRIGLAARLSIEAETPTAPPERVAPRTAVEEVIAALWTEVLRHPPSGVHDDFFAAGGDSILAAQLTGRLRESLRVELSLLAFFDAPTVAGMAESLGSQLAEAS